MKKAIINECYEHALIEIKVGAAESGDKSWSIHLCITYYVQSDLSQMPTQLRQTHKQSGHLRKLTLYIWVEEKKGRLKKSWKGGWMQK